MLISPRVSHTPSTTRSISPNDKLYESFMPIYCRDHHNHSALKSKRFRALLRERTLDCPIRFDKRDPTSTGNYTLAPAEVYGTNRPLRTVSSKIRGPRVVCVTASIRQQYKTARLRNSVGTPNQLDKRFSCKIRLAQILLDRNSAR